MRKNKLQGLKWVILSAVSILSFHTVSASNITTQQVLRLTTELAQKIQSGEILAENDYYDSLLFNQPLLLPNQDDDNDGILNQDEIEIINKNGKIFYRYNSHPRLADTDGDGIIDSKDLEPLNWNFSNRDAMIFMKMAYRDYEFSKKMLSDNYYENLAKQKEEAQPIFDSKEYQKHFYFWSNFNQQYSRYWKIVKHWENSSGYFAYWLTNQSDFPFIKNQTINVLAVRGTDDAQDNIEDVKLFLGKSTRQDSQVTDSISWIADPNYILTPEILDANFSVKNRSEVENIYITGHSLGGYLSQLAGVYAKKHNYDQVKHVYTFNAPQIKNSKYKAESDKLSQSGFSSHFRVANGDFIPKFVGYFEPNINVGEVVNGHKTASFFEDNPVRNFFTVGEKSLLSNNNNYQPKLRELSLTKKPLNVNYISSSNKKIVKSLKAVAFNEQRYSKFLSTNVPDYYKVSENQIQKNEPIKDKNITIEPINYVVTYNFQENNHLVQSVKVNVNVENLNDYELPVVPSHPASQYFKYVLSNPEQLKRTTNLSNNLVFNMDLNVEKAYNKEQWDDLIIDFVEKDTMKKVGTFHKKILKETNKVYFNEEWVPLGYRSDVFPENLQKNIVNTVKVTKKNYILRYNYIISEPEKKTITKTYVKQLNDKTPDLEIPSTSDNNYEYLIASKDEIPANVTNNGNYNIYLKYIKKANVITKVNYLFQGQVIALQQISKNPGEQVAKSDLVVPHGYTLTQQNPQLESGKENNLEVIKRVYNITYNFVDKKTNSTVKTVTIPVKYQEDYQVPTVPNSNNLDFVYQISDIPKINNVEEEHQITVLLDREEILQNTIIRFVLSDDESRQVSQISFTTKPSEFDAKINQIEIPNGYDLLTKKSLAKPNALNIWKIQPKNYQITVQFLFNDQIIKQENLNLKYNQTLNLKDFFDNDYSYIISENQRSFVVTADATFKIHVNRQPNFYLIEFIDENNNSLGKIIKIEKQNLINIKVPQNYHLASDWDLNALNDQQVNKIILERNIYQVKINYLSNKKIIASQLIEKKYGETLVEKELEIPKNFVIFAPWNNLTVNAYNTINVLVKSTNAPEEQLTNFSNEEAEILNLEFLSTFEKNVYLEKLNKDGNLALTSAKQLNLRKENVYLKIANSNSFISNKALNQIKGWIIQHEFDSEIFNNQIQLTLDNITSLNNWYIQIVNEDLNAKNFNLDEINNELIDKSLYQNILDYLNKLFEFNTLLNKFKDSDFLEISQYKNIDITNKNLELINESKFQNAKKVLTSKYEELRAKFLFLKSIALSINGMKVESLIKITSSKEDNNLYKILVNQLIDDNYFEIIKTSNLTINEVRSFNLKMEKVLNIPIDNVVKSVLKNQIKEWKANLSKNEEKTKAQETKKNKLWILWTTIGILSGLFIIFTVVAYIKRKFKK
ncbi:lipase family protein [Mycoplasma buteonis]|uniref:lipase family protein n=1 Tax=Mycoplasma buteonis TaxID=171280 RepID=UPI00055C0F34|nr:hypothetical protein [Mycoplasma buteonis]